MNNLSLDMTTKLLRATFLNNMEVFKNILPEIYDFFKNYQQGNTLLTIDDDDNVNLVDNGNLVYKGDPKKLAVEQLDVFAKNPKCFSYGLEFSEEPYFEHEKVLKALTERQQAETGQLSDLQIEVPWNEPQLDFFCMIGCGLGYQIEELFNRKKIKIFYLYEPSADVFYAAMHCIDFKPLIDKCKAIGGSFTIGIGSNEFQFVNQINELLKINGFYLVSRIFAYRHYFSEENHKAFKLIHEIAHRYSAGWGFFEDEIISLVHTLENIDNDFPILKANNQINNPIKQLPVIIVGNGPSLDNDIELLKNRQDQIIIISCGTSLKSLLHNNIVPNIHIEMERTAMLDDHYHLFTDDEHSIIKTIPIIALNTVYTGLLKRFSQAYTMLKINDGGMDFVKFLSPENSFEIVKYCNPTVSNTAVMAMLHLGFKKIYLLGVDLGFVDDEHHHSKSSMYYKGEWEGKEESNKSFKGATRTTKGNFREEVYTTQIFDSSVGVMEFAIQDFSDVDVYNCSDGALIRGTKPLPFDELVVKPQDINLRKELLHLLDDSFALFSKSKKYVHNFLETQYLSKLKMVIDTFIEFLDEPINSRTELSNMFSRQNDYIYLLSTRKDTLLYFRFMKGSMIYFQSCIMTNCASYTNEKMRMEYTAYALSEMKTHFLYLYNDLIKGYNKPAKV
ncbi:MAG: motility associated factor glycosyltransferase family protein [Alteromonadaceae bacterium]|nr:motility associated factor glycosyltransferase family protein [Alteromonadaceae bacterium]